ncbi:hypothetical protein Lepto7375DRAFT_5008 [Leptolyngbya sp. PCC 7375]|nr:hypothetical protein Lepto7375DRAFT_5008 [Leptolyngbya sp. PCC 7375]
MKNLKQQNMRKGEKLWSPVLLGDASPQTLYNPDGG